MQADTALTAAIEARVEGDGMWAVLTAGRGRPASAASSSLQALIILPNGLAAASTPGDQACAASSASAADAAPSSIALASLTSSKALSAVGETAPRSK
jgi:hypothetical protein